jgi:geranylgeranyl diphosphate synthase, type I
MQTLAVLYLKEIDYTMREIVKTYLPDEDGFGVMLRYALGWTNENDQPYTIPTGKRLRPLFLLLTANATTDNWQKALPAAAAVELLHNFSLIHDDIQDNSFTRHSRPTVWKQWGQANAINAGDAMFTLAYSALASLSVKPEILVKIWQIFNATNLELTRGQHLDMRFETQSNVTVEEYISMIKGKSASLIATSAHFGALIGSENPELAQHYADFGLSLGIAFQIHDDILGIWGDPQVTGKSAATDIISRKKSYPILFGLKQLESLQNLYAQPHTDNKQLQDILNILDEVNAQEATRQAEQHYYRLAMQSLDKAQPSSEAMQYLKVFVDFLFARDH